MDTKDLRDTLFFTIFDVTGNIHIAHRPDDDAGGCMLIKKVPEWMIKRAYAQILQEESKQP